MTITKGQDGFFMYKNRAPNGRYNLCGGWVAALRNSISAALMMLVFLLLDRPRFSMKKTVWCYGIYWVLLITGFSIWYALDQEGFVRASGMTAIPAVGIFCAAMSGDGNYPSPGELFRYLHICGIVL